ncbi:hypothetical protein OESDEN_17851 [Oesophagostomum dentatum]|uniref:Uncharacterized protein n=1 Tax=Oesophagostomum dentatum TaxID=61180 RepID=A0A0B1SGV9_OESDE|nr:hypothetical protein OESDEN_17851 [Oesophagostomum dentatum]
MFAAPSIGKLASQCVLRESRDAELLEEVDEDDLVLVTGLSPEGTPKPSRTTIVSVAVALVSCSVAVQSFAFLVTLGILAVSGYLTKIAAEWRLKAFVRKMDELDVTARRANRAMLQREMVSFGLGLSTSQALSACRLHLFLFCRKNIFYMTSLAQLLVSADFMSEERQRLMSNFYTDEMRDLLHSDASLNSPHVTQGGITTLLDLFVLHRSEVLRLLVLYLYRSSLLSAMSLLFRMLFIHCHGTVCS